MALPRRQFLRLAGLLSLTPFQLNSALGQSLKPGFDTRDTVEALYRMLGNAATMASDRIDLQLPQESDLGAVVPVQVSTDLAEVESISLLSPINHTPLIATFRFAPGTEAFVETRIKLAGSTRVMAVVKAENRLFSSTRFIQVNRVGCRV